jgi:Tfp pilus assembly protein PilO
MNRWYERRRWIYAVLALILALNAFIYWNWLRLPATETGAEAATLLLLGREVTARAAEVARLERVRDDSPHLRPQLAKFVADRVLAERTGFARVAAELEAAADDTGVGLNVAKYEPQADKAQADLTRIEISVSVEGRYASLVRFLDALERSPHFYLIHDLTVGSQRGGDVRLEMKVVTYLRKAAA